MYVYFVKADYSGLTDAQLDFQVHAITMYEGYVHVADGLWDLVGRYELGSVVGPNSGWSETQTISIPAPFPTETPSTTIAPTSTLLSTSIPTESPLTSTSSVATITPTAIIIEAVSTWFYIIVSGMALVIAILLAVIAIILRRKQNLINYDFFPRIDVPTSCQFFCVKKLLETGF